jgi:hypothetical protein
MVLVRLHRVRRRELRDLIVRAWRMVAPPKLIAEYDKPHAKESQTNRKKPDTSAS